MADGSPDAALVEGINGISGHLPGFLDSFLSFCGEYGLPLASVAMVVVTWMWARRQARPLNTVAGVSWALLGGVVALMLNVPVRALVARPRPFVEYPDQVKPLVEHAANGSFASDHATFTMAVAVGLLLVHRKYGLIAGGIALAEGFLRVFMGVHYPSDIIGGYALAAATVLLLAPLAMALLVPSAHRLSATRIGPALAAAVPAAGPAGPAGELPRQRRGGRRGRGSRGRAGGGRGRDHDPEANQHLAA
ncbi:phosphatase PAP2 family protein [Phaeacidiphilus oryzae]|uniref:phosphatase PAP2 family protein n=1 Tax=Phaeacidiphilus oryzae TaxID=348818 RepID=UPI00056726A5|nr:phosphatase PAP2 family protein [Phaeacidiphilus oryzae]